MSSITACVCDARRSVYTSVTPEAAEVLLAALAADPDTKPFVSVGKKIKKGDTVMIVEAMKTMNHIHSSIDGVVKEICVEDGQPIEYDQVLIILE